MHQIVAWQINIRQTYLPSWPIFDFAVATTQAFSTLQVVFVVRHRPSIVFTCLDPSLTLERLAALASLTFPFSNTPLLLLEGQFDAEGSPSSREVAQGTNTYSADPALDDGIRAAHRKMVHEREAVMWLLLDGSRATDWGDLIVGLQCAVLVKNTHDTRLLFCSVFKLATE